LAVQVLFADHNLGFAAGRNATVKASRGRYLVLLDTSIELNGDIWSELDEVLSEEKVGVAGPYGLVTTDLREFQEASGPEVDAIEGYMLAFRRELWSQIGPIDEKFRFYRLMDIYLSFFFKAAGFQAVTTPQVEKRIIKHPHLEWYSLSEEEQRTKSKKNYDLFRARWHHGESLLVANYKPQNHWFGHDKGGHVAGKHQHSPEELPLPGVAHSHKHQHWPDHDHEHAHYHDPHGNAVMAGAGSAKVTNNE
jgi:cysteinyl-tRNA synthetase